VTDTKDAPAETPAAYIRQLKSSYPPKFVDATSVSPVLKEFYGGNEEDARKALEELRDRDYGHELLTRLMPGLPEVFPELVQKGLLAVGEVNDAVPNAKAIRLDGPTYAVVFNTGLQRFLYRVTRVLSTRFHPQGSSGSSEDMSFDESCRILTDVFFWYQETGQAFGPDYPVTQFQVTIASMLATEAESFFLAHELGHVFNDLRALATKAPPEQREATWADEAEADRFALSVLINSRNRKNPVAPLQFSYAGAEIALCTFSGLEALGVDFGHSHPPAHERTNTIRQQLQETCADAATFENITTLSKPLAVLFDHFVDRLKSPDWESFLDRATADVMKDLDRLLEECTGGMVPDYCTFRANVAKLFDHLSSHRLYARVAHAAADFARHMQTVNEGAGEKSKRDAWVSFQKYKLFMSMIRDMNEPFKSLLEEALDIPT
jgi:hypothetical protein